MRQRLVVFLVPFLLLQSLNGAPFTSIMEKALTESPEAGNVELSYESGLISIALSELDDSFDYSLSASLSPLYGDMEIMKADDLSFAVTSPDGDTVVRTSMPFGVRYDASGAVLSPSVSVTHAFDWGYDEEKLEDLQTEALRLSVERSHDADIIALKRSVISIISELLQAERSRLEAEKTLRDAEKELSDSLSLGIVTENSIPYMELSLARQRAEDTISILKTERSELESRFTSLTGLEWDGVSEIPEPVFPDVLSAGMTSALREADIQAVIAAEEVLLEESRQNPKRLITGAGISGVTEIADGLKGENTDSVVLGVSGTIGWESDDWSVSASGGGSWNRRMEFTPSVTITGSWQSGTAESDRITLRSLQNEALVRESEARDARRDFEEERNALWSRILSWKSDWAEMDVETSYRQAIADMARLKHEKGISSYDEVENTALSLSLLLLDRDILLLEGLQLEAEAEALLL